NTRTISVQQLMAEVKGICAGYHTIESKCIEVDQKQSGTSCARRPKAFLNDDQYRALTALHITGMREVRDFFFTSSHPKASAALRGLSAEYDMPARFWTHIIHDYLKVLRPRLPESFEHMIVFILEAYSMMQLLEETTNSGSYTTECTGDLARYRFAIEDEDANARLHWKGVAIQQYSRVLDLDPTLGRLYHHSSILS
ncbi:hypothetical protein LZ31DRAFT_442142, partial [Colletotrichum somersetense]